MIKNAAVMAGGQSRRFKRDKTLEMFRGKRLIEYSADTLKAASENLIIVAKDCGKYSFVGVPCVADRYEQQCPMVGILTALRHYESDVFVVAADTPFMMAKHAERLMSALDGHDAAVPVIGGRHHPLYAAYGAGMIPVFERSIEQGDYALMKCLSSADSVFPDETVLLDTAGESLAFMNINTLEDLSVAENKYFNP